MAKTIIQQAQDLLASVRNKTLNSGVGQTLRKTWQTPVSVPTPIAKFANYPQQINNFQANNRAWLAKPAPQPYQNLSNSFNILTNPAQNENRNLLIQGLQTPEPGRAPITQQSINFLTNVAATQTGGYNKIREGVNAFKTGQYGQAIAKPLFGLGEIATSGLPTNLVANMLSSNQKPINNEKNDIIRRISSGFISGQTGENLATNVPSKNINVLGMEFDPLKTAGSMYGFTKNPIWDKIFGKTIAIDKWAPATSKVMNFLISRATKGGVEGTIQALAEVPVDASKEEKAKVFTKNILFGMGSEIGADVAGKVFGKFWNSLPIRSKNEIGDVVESGIKNNQVKPIDNLTTNDGINFIEKGKTPTFELGRTKAEIDAIDKIRVLADQNSWGGSVIKSVRDENGNLISPQGVEGTIQKSVLPEVSTTSKQVLPPETLPIQPTKGVSLPKNLKTSPSTPIIDPIQKITDALTKAAPLEKQQGKIYSKVRSQQAGALAGIGEQLGGESGYYKKLGQLKGEMPKVQFESIRKSVTQSDINEIFNRVEKSNLSVFEKVNAQGALQKLLGAQGGSVPTKSELNLLNEVFPPEFIQAVLANRSGFQKAMSLVEGGLNLPRAVMATADLSAPLRQGIFLIGRPKQWIPAFKDMFKYAFSKKAYEGLAEEIKVRPNAKLYREANLAITDNSPILGNREEMFMSNLTEKLPVFGKIAAGSNRAYSGFLNKLRVDVFDDLVNSAKKQGIDIEGKTLTDIGNFVNSATGRGSLPKFIEKSAPALNAAFFSPRLMASRINLLNPSYYAKLEPFVRKEAIKSLLTFAGTAGTVLGLASLGGAEVSADPRNADFGKIKVGNTRYDVLGGFQQYIRLGAQLASGQIVSSTTGKIITLGEGYKPLTRKDILMRFFENKTSPVASFVIGLTTGTNSIGDKFNLSAEVLNRFIPMVAQDIYDLQKEYGPGGFLMALPGVFGAGSQTYGKQELVTGKNQLGEDTTQLRAPKGLNEVISDKVFGAPPLNTTAQYSADAYFKQLQAMPVEEARIKFNEIAQSNLDLAKKILQSAKDNQLGITPNDETMKAKGVASGDRAVAIAKQFNKLKTDSEKAKLWEEYVKKGIITKEVAAQLVKLLK